MSKGRRWIFTLNNYTETDLTEIPSWDVRYVKFGKETCPSTGTPHLQGFCIMHVEARLSKMKKIHPTAHWTLMKGSLESNHQYCSKEGDWYEYGDPPVTQAQKGQDEKEKWANIRKLAKEGNFDELDRLYPKELSLYDRNIERIAKKARKCATIDGEMEHEWFVGPSATGKSSTARLENPDHYMKDPCTKWWDGYEGQDTVIIDDFDVYQKAQGGDMKRWLDRYPFQAEFKGGMSLIRPRKIIVTSNYHPEHIWDDCITVAAINRRVKIRQFGDIPKPFVSSFCSVNK